MGFDTDEPGKGDPKRPDELNDPGKPNCAAEEEDVKAEFVQFG